MADDADAAVAFAQAVEDVEDLVEGLLVEAAEALVDEEGVAGSPLSMDTLLDQEKQGKNAPSGCSPRGILSLRGTDGGRGGYAALSAGSREPELSNVR